MKNSVLPDLDSDTIERLKQRFPDLSNIDLPKMEDFGKSADQTIDRLRGRSRNPIWPWLAAAVGLVAVIGTIAAYLTWLRRPALESVGSTGASDALETPSTSDSFDGTDPFQSTVDRAWPTETTSEVVIGAEEA